MGPPSNSCVIYGMGGGIFGMGFMTYKGLQCLSYGCLCRGCVAPSFSMQPFSNSIHCLLFFQDVSRLKPRWRFYLSMKYCAHLDSTLVTSCFPKLKTCVGILPKHEKQCPHMLHLGWHFVLLIFYESHQFLMKYISLSQRSLGEHLEGS